MDLSMKQYLIKLPFTCGQLAKGLYIMLIVPSVYFTFIQLHPLGVLGLIGSVVGGLFWWIERIGEGKQTFPFTFSCKCDKAKVKGNT